jgi:hypothetical protein
VRPVELPRGQSALLRDPEDVPERLRRPVLAKQAEVFGSSPELRAAAEMNVEPTDAADMAAALVPMAEMNDLIIVAFVHAWSYRRQELAEDGTVTTGEKLPVSVGSLMEIPGDGYDRLRQLCQESWATLAKASQAMTPDGVTDPASPTGP